MRFRIVLRRSNGRFVKEAFRDSKYAAKQLRNAWEDRHDESYYVEVIREESNGEA